MMRKVGLALGSGGARGWAHIGVIRAIQEAGWAICCVAGTSMGAVVGAAFASGMLDQLEVAARNIDWKEVVYHFFEVSLPRSGLIDGKKVVMFLRKHIPALTIEELNIPFACVATDVEAGTEVVLREGDVLEAVRASISIPGIFTPVCLNGRNLVDGGLVNPVPVSVARALGAEYVVAVDVRPSRLVRSGQKVSSRRTAWRLPKMPTPEFLRPLVKQLERWDRSVLHQINRWQAREPSLSVFDVIGNSIAIMQSQITDIRLKIDPPDLWVRPSTALGVLEFHRAAEAIKRGYQTMRAALQSSPALS